MVRVPDERVDRLSALFSPKKTTYAQIQFVDSAAAGHASARVAAKGPDLFSAVRNCDALLAVVRDFENPAVPREGGVDAERDRRDLEAELVLNDLAIVETRLEKIAKELRIGKKQGEAEHALLERCKTWLEAERPLRDVRARRDEDAQLLRGFQFLTLKPLLVVYNQDDASTRVPPEAGPGTLAIALRAHLEREIVALPPEERDAFRAELGIAEDGLSLVIRACYRAARADLVLHRRARRGARVDDPPRRYGGGRGGRDPHRPGQGLHPRRGGTVRPAARARLARQGPREGLVRLEGRDYVVADGDCVEIRFNK